MVLLEAGMQADRQGAPNVYNAHALYKEHKI